MKKLIILGAVLVSLPFFSFAQTSTTTSENTETIKVTNPGLLPGDFLYFLDRWSEALNIAITFNNEKKARKHLEYAKERVAEMKEVLKDEDAKLDDVKSAKDNFDERVAKAAMLAKEEKDNGNDVADLARDLDDELDEAEDALKDIYKEHKDKSSRAEEVIRAKIAALAPGDPQIQGLTQALESIVKEKDEATKEDDDLDEELMDEQELFEEIMGKELSAQKHLEQAMRLRDSMMRVIPSDLSTSSEKLMKDAQAAMKRGDFESAKRISEQAENVLEKAREIMDDFDMDMDDDDDDDDDESSLDDLEDEIKKGERMMDEFNR